MVGNPQFGFGADSVRAAIQAKRSGETSMVTEYGLKFLEEDACRNTITYDEFRKYIPLFNKAQFTQLSKEQSRELYYEWGQRVNLQLPVFVIDTQTQDPNGKPYPANNPNAKKFKVVYSLPPAYRSLNAVNKLGGNVVQIAAELLAGARTSSNPFDQRGEFYSGELAKIIQQANEQELVQKQDEFRRLESQILNKGQPDTIQTKEEEPDKDADPVGIDADWGDE